MERLKREKEITKSGGGGRRTGTWTNTDMHEVRQKIASCICREKLDYGRSERVECLCDGDRKPEMELIQMQNAGSSVEEHPAVRLEGPPALVALLHRISVIN